MTVDKVQVEEVQTSRSLVLLPDIFEAFGTKEPKLHPDYQSVKIESEKWLAQHLDLNVKAQAKLARADFTYFTAVWMAGASREAFRTGADWMNWAFFFDDEFEVGSLKDNLDRAKATIDAVLATISDGSVFPESAGAPPISFGLLESYAHICRRLRSLGSDMLVNRYRQGMERYAAGILGQILDLEQSRTRTVDEMVELRRDSLGILPCFVRLHLELHAELPNFVLNHHLIREVEVLSSDLVIIHNDIVSYAKEEVEDVVHNLIACCRLGGMTNSMAFEYVGNISDKRLERFDNTLRFLPSWSEGIDANFARYVEGCRNMVISNIHWSFRSERYFGARKDEGRRTRLIELLDNPPYLQKHALGSTFCESRQVFGQPSELCTPRRPPMAL